MCCIVFLCNTYFYSLQTHSPFIFSVLIKLQYVSADEIKKLMNNKKIIKIYVNIYSVLKLPFLKKRFSELGLNQFINNGFT